MIESILIGIGLSAAAGFRLFIPFLAISLLSLLGIADFTGNYPWLGTYPALITLLIATVFEIAAYYVPFIDNLLDVIEFPLAVIAGTLLTYSIIPEMSPVAKWGIALIAGGGIGGLVRVAIAGIRSGLSLASFGLGNFILATVELILSMLLSIIVIFLPIVSIIVIIFVIISLRKNKLKIKPRVK